MQIIEEIGKGVLWYEAKSNEAPVEELLTFSDRLTTRSFRLAVMVADAKEQLNNAKFLKKAKIIDETKKFQSQSNSLNASKDLAKLEIKEEERNETNCDNYYTRLNLLLSQTNKILDGVRQRISHEKNEKQRSDYLSHNS